MEKVERYGVVEITVQASEPGIWNGEKGNPFKDCHIFGTFTSLNEEKRFRGFYDGEGIFKIRFMPSFEEEYRYIWETDFACREISAREGEESDRTLPESRGQGSFTVSPAREGNHGIVRVAKQFHFAYEDGTRYEPVGTTCYVWELQSKELQEQTLKTLAESPFNKIRFCIFPKHYNYNLNEPACYPYRLREDSPWQPSDFSRKMLENAPRTPFGGIDVSIDEPEKVWDFEQFNPGYFRHIEESVSKLQGLGIEADIILMHPYDRWGFSRMGTENENFYLQYVVARLGAFRNVWWAMANEYDLFLWKSIPQWEENAETIVREDPYRHLRSIHNCRVFYDHSRAWITHCSIQRVDLYKTAESTLDWRQQYGKPIVLDEIAYEGNIGYGWGNISGEEMTRRFWEAYTRGGYGQHGETYLHPQDILWWSHGGKLHGTSPERIAFLRRIMAEAPGYLEPAAAMFDESVVSDGGMFGPASYLLYYFGANRPGERRFMLPEGKRYKAQVIDTWEMTVEDAGVFSGTFVLPMPGKPYIAVRFIADGE